MSATDGWPWIVSRAQQLCQSWRRCLRRQAQQFLSSIKNIELLLLLVVGRAQTRPAHNLRLPDIHSGCELGQKKKEREDAIDAMGSLQAQVPPQEDDVTLSAVFDNNNPPRLGTDVGIRLPLSAMAAFASGMALGASHGSTKAAFRFRAENAHRFPTNPTGWYQYHKSKNYTSMIGGLKEGTKLGMKVGIGAVAFCIFEETVDHARGSRDFLSTVTAGLSFSGVYSLLGNISFSSLSLSLYDTL